MTRRGGILLDLFIIAVLSAAGIYGFLLWRGGGLSLSIPKGLLPAVLPAAAPPPSSEPDLDVSDRSAWLQVRCRELLSNLGVRERHVVKTYNAQRQADGIQWLEDTMELRRPLSFDEGRFMSALARMLEEKRLSVMDDRREGGSRILELGDRKRVYQRLIFVGGATTN